MEREGHESTQHGAWDASCEMRVRVPTSHIPTHMRTRNALVRRMHPDGLWYWHCDSCPFFKRKLKHAKRHEGRCPLLMPATTPRATPSSAESPVTPAQRGYAKLRRAIAKAITQKDPWEEFHIERRATERVMKHKVRRMGSLGGVAPSPDHVGRSTIRGRRSGRKGLRWSRWTPLRSRRARCASATG